MMPVRVAPPTPKQSSKGSFNWNTVDRPEDFHSQTTMIEGPRLREASA